MILFHSYIICFPTLQTHYIWSKIFNLQFFLFLPLPCRNWKWLAFATSIQTSLHLHAVWPDYLYYCLASFKFSSWYPLHFMTDSSKNRRWTSDSIVKGKFPNYLPCNVQLILIILLNTSVWFHNMPKTVFLIITLIKHRPL